MEQESKPSRAADPAALVLGYLNFSSGAFDPAAWRALSDLYAAAEPAGPQGVVERPDAVVSVAAFLKERLMPYQVPVQMRCMDDFPRTPSLKVSQPELRKLFEEA